MLLKKYLTRYFEYDWRFGLFLILLFGLPRFAVVLHSYMNKSYAWVMLVFLLMWITPFLLLNKNGRKFIGLQKPNHYWRLCTIFISGALICLLIFCLFVLLFGKSTNNAFVYIGSNNAVASLTLSGRYIYFIIAVIPSMLFSPIGEEFLYRGIIHGSFVKKFGDKTASIFDSLAFSLTHIAHFGIIYIAGNWQFVLLPTIIWVISMFITCRIFFLCKQYSNSIWGAVISHAGFNAMMMYLIFYHTF